MNHTFLSTIDSVLGDCGLLICHIGETETIRNLPGSYLKSSRTDNNSTLPHIGRNNRWVHFIDAIQEVKGFQNIVDYNEQQQKFIVGMKCKQCRSNWIWNSALFQIQMAKRMTNSGIRSSLFDGATMIQYQFSSRIVEEVWCRDDQDDDDATYCRGHGYDPDIANVPLSSLVVGTSLVANGGRGVFTTQTIAKGSYITVDDCVGGMIVPIPTLGLLYTAAESTSMAEVSEFWEVVAHGFVNGYGWMDSFLVSRFIHHSI